MPSQNGSVDHREMERKAQDTVEVYNPFFEDIPVPWDGLVHWVVPGNAKDIGYGPGILHCPRYIADNYITKTLQRLQFSNEDAAVVRENAKRVKELQQKKMDGEQEAAFVQTLRMDTGDQREHDFRIIFKRVVNEYGSTYAPLKLPGGESASRLNNEDLMDKYAHPEDEVQYTDAPAPKDNSASEAAKEVSL